MRLFGGAYRTVPDFIHMLCDAAQALPDGWHLRLKEHPSGQPCAAAIIAAHAGARPELKIVLDNTTDTFAQVAASGGVITVNSSVGLESMWYEKPVVACGQAFWALDGVAHRAPDAVALMALLAQPQNLRFDPTARAALLTYLDQVYYPRYPATAADKMDVNARIMAAKLAG